MYVRWWSRLVLFQPDLFKPSASILVGQSQSDSCHSSLVPSFSFGRMQVSGVDCAKVSDICAHGSDSGTSGLIL
jgi:hypothetical protein